MKLSLIILSAIVSRALAATQQVTVAPSGQLMFQPNTLTAAAGDMVVFTVESQNGPHSITSAKFNTPCQSDGVVNSGFISGVGATTTSSSTKGSSGGGGYRRAMEERATVTQATNFTLMVNDTNPIWLFCEQVGHCQAGMVMVINPPASGNQTLDSFKTAAQSAPATSSSAAATTSGAAASSIDGKMLNYGATLGAGALTLVGLVSSSLVFL